VSYNPITDFLGLLRQGSNAVSAARMPGMDFVLAALSRAGVINLWSGQEAPTTNQATTVWIMPALPSWTAEGVVFLFNSSTGAYELATPALWSALLTTISSEVYQAVLVGAANVNGGTTLLAIRRSAPVTTSLVLPALASRVGGLLRVVDWSTSYVEHAITFTTPDGASIMRDTSFTMYSTVNQRASVALYPSSDLNGWIVQ
jgi:hypothetical protein